MTQLGSGQRVVDVVIATRGNRPELLQAALNGVLTQTYPGRIDCTVIFDQTEPDTSLVLERDNRSVQVAPNVHTPGLAGARNSGVERGQGEFIAFCDDDDEWLPTKIERQVEALTDSAALTSVTGIVVVYADHESVRVPDASEMTLETLVRERVMAAHPSTVLVRRTAMTGPIGPVDEDIPGSFGEDFDWIIRAAKAGSFAVVDQPLVRVRWGGSLFSQNWRNIIAALDYLVAKHPEFAADRHARARIQGQRSFALAALGDRRSALKEVARTLKSSPRERRGYVATLVALRIISAQRVMDLAHKRGKGI